MLSPLEQLCELEVVIRELYKIDSKLISGQIILAYRENRKLIAALEKIKQDIVKESKSKVSLPSIPGCIPRPLEEADSEEMEKEFGQETNAEANKNRML